MSFYFLPSKSEVQDKKNIIYNKDSEILCFIINTIIKLKIIRKVHKIEYITIESTKEYKNLTGYGIELH